MDTTVLLDDLKRTLKRSPGDPLLGIVLFGSMARGDYHKDSDIDVAVIVRGISRGLQNQILDEVAELELQRFPPLSALALSAEEFNGLKRRERIKTDEIP